MGAGGERYGRDVSPTQAVLSGGIVVLLLLVALWALQLKTKDAGVADVGWAAGLGFLAIFYAAMLADGLGARRWLVAAVVAIWSFRLTRYIIVDRVLAPEEDGRYQALRQRWGSTVQPKLLGFFLGQAALAILLSIHFLLVMLHPSTELRVWDWLGALVGLGAIGGESLADRQLERFKASPDSRGKTCREGLWRYSRHPNYFFEWIYWLAFAIVAVEAPWWWATLIAPAVMYVFIRFVTGIPPTELRAIKSRGDEYREYQRTTNAFFPWFPRHG